MSSRQTRINSGDSRATSNGLNTLSPFSITGCAEAAIAADAPGQADERLSRLSDDRAWYSTANIPDVQEAFRIVPHGKQAGLEPVMLRVAIPIDPTKEDFFTRVIEYRKQNKADDRPQHFLKILANSTSYGTYLELNPIKIDPKDRPKITVYSGEHVIEQAAPDTN